MSRFLHRVLITLIIGLFSMFPGLAANTDNKCIEALSESRRIAWVQQMVNIIHDNMANSRKSGGVIVFKSALTGRDTTISTSTFLGESSAQVLLTSDKHYVVKIYTPKSKRRYRMEVQEIVLTQFLLDMGIDVPRIIVYSINVFMHDEKPMFIVKEYRKGINFKQREMMGINPYSYEGNPYIYPQFKGLKDALTPNEAKTLGISIENELQNLIRKYKEIIRRNFLNWLELQSFYNSYLEAFPNIEGKTVGDIGRRDNWLLTSKGWLLIDM